MDDLIVIILTLIIFVVGALGQINKKKSKQQPAGQHNKSGGFWDLLDEEMELNEEPAPISRKMDTVQPERDVTLQPSAPDLRFTDEGERVFRNRPVRVKEKTEEQVIKEVEEFSLRKAVIYSEILNRKYT